MPLIRRRRPLAFALVVAVLGALSAAPAPSTVGLRVATQPIPERLSDAEFWRLVTEFSEEGGDFRSDNFISNEVTFQHIIPELKRAAKQGGVYMGVGPDQNFTYMVALQQRVAFIVDIRRQAMLQHLLYKALFEMSADRAEFLSRLFSRPRPRGLDTGSTAEALFLAYEAVAPDSARFQENLRAVKDRLVKQHRFALSEGDLQAIEYVYGAFYAAGPEITYSFSPARGQFGGRRMPTYAELMMETDGQGVQRSYLATEQNYRWLRELQRRNLLVPVVGDFAGDKAIRAVGRYLKQRGATVSAFYTSNVEQYLFRQDYAWRAFFDNVAALPVDSSSVFIRAVFNTLYFNAQIPGPGPRSETLISPIAATLKAVSDGRVQSYGDAIQISR